MLTVFCFLMFLRYTSRSDRVAGINAISGSVINVALDTQQKNARHSNLKLTLSYNRDQVGNRSAHQAAIMNHTRNHSLKMTNRSDQNSNFTQISDFFDELDGKEPKILNIVTEVGSSTVLVAKPTKSVKSLAVLNYQNPLQQN